MTTLLDWDGTDEGPSTRPLRRVVENLHEVSALVEMLGVLLTLEGHGDAYEEKLALELVAEAGHLGQALGQRALELLDAEAGPGVSTLAKTGNPAGPTGGRAPIGRTRKPRERAARRRAA